MRVQPSTKALFTTGSSLHVRFILCLAASLVILALENRGELTAQRVPLAALTAPIQQLASFPSRFFNRLEALSQKQNDLLAENQRLKQEVLLLRGQQLKFAALEQENLRLRGLLDSTFKVGDQVLIAEPLAINAAPYENLIVVNKGARYGLAAGQAVVDGNGVVGQVLRVTANTADVVMITDPSHAIPVQVNRNGLRTIAVGTGRTDRLNLPYLSGNADIQPCDLLVTSGLGGVFPAGYPVAKVVAATDSAASGRLSAAPLARLEHNRELLVVRSDSTPLPRIPDKTDAALPAPLTHAAR